MNDVNYATLAAELSANRTTEARNEAARIQSEKVAAFNETKAKLAPLIRVIEQVDAGNAGKIYYFAGNEVNQTWSFSAQAAGLWAAETRSFVLRLEREHARLIPMTATHSPLPDPDAEAHVAHVSEVDKLIPVTLSLLADMMRRR